jgi:hypothetical protein
MTARSRVRTRMRRLLAVAAGVALVGSGVGLTAITEQPAEAAQAAAVLDSFDPANIIDDAVMFNGSTMTADAIQSFLNAQQPTCAPGATCLKAVTADMPALGANPMCGALGAQQNATAAQIIAAVGRACNVNPQVILVMLQKEQTLITGRRPYSGESVSVIYRKATGLGCPDTAACDPAKYGLFNQLYGVAYWLVRYTTPPGTTGPGWTSYSWFPVGKPNGVLYHPNAACGARTITIKNKATASLYYYTPYQPNAAALAAGWGLGDGCSAYGNRNFFLYFTTWFGSTRYTVTGAVKTFWTAHKSTYGDPTSNVASVSGNGGGTVQQFAKGSIYTSALGTYGVTGAVRAKYTALGGPAGALGWPRKAEAVRKGANGGTVQGFQKGTVYVSSAGTAAVLAPIYAKYVSNGFEVGKLGWPTGDATTSTAKGGATQQTFQGGRIVVAGTSASIVTGTVLSKWLQRGAQANILAWPIGDVRTVSAHGTKGTVQAFQGGAVYVLGKKVYTVTGMAADNYAVHGGPTGALGWPTGAAKHASANGGGWSQKFSGGTVVWTASTGARALTGRILKLYVARGGTSGTIGWPTSTKHDGHGVGGTVTVFTSGRIYSSKQGTVAVRGGILARYLAKGGTSGVLGWPTTNARDTKGTTVQLFQHGRITYSKSGGAKASTS